MKPAHLNASGLSGDQRRRFDERGMVRLEGAISPCAVEEMAARLWDDLAHRHGAQREHRATWRTERPTAFRALQDTGAFNAMASLQVRAALDDLMGRDRWEEPPVWGQPLVCFPGRERDWTVPHQGWHLDGPAEPRRDEWVRMGRVFAILGPLSAGGGATLVAEGSHRLVEALAARNGGALSSAEMRMRLKAEHPWFRDLATAGEAAARIGRFMDRETRVGEVALRLAEMTGEPGDVWLMHPSCLHAAAPNVLAVPRLALTQFVAPKV